MKKRCEAGIKRFFIAQMKKAYPHDTFYWSEISEDIKDIWRETYFKHKVRSNNEEDL